MGMPRIWSCGLGAPELGATAETGVTKKLLWPLRCLYCAFDVTHAWMCSCFAVLQLHGRMRREVSPWTTCFPREPGGGIQTGSGWGWPRLESELDVRPENEDGSSLERGWISSSSSSSSCSPSPPSSGTGVDGGNGTCSCSLLSRGPMPGNGYGRFLSGASLLPSAVIVRAQQPLAEASQHCEHFRGHLALATLLGVALHRQGQQRQRPSRYEAPTDEGNDAQPPPRGCSADFSVRGVRSVRQNSYTSYTRRRVHSFQLQGSASTPLVPIAGPKPDSDFLLWIETVRPISSSSLCERGPQSPAQPYPLKTQRPTLEGARVEGASLMFSW